MLCRGGSLTLPKPVGGSCNIGRVRDPPLRPSVKSVPVGASIARPQKLRHLERSAAESRGSDPSAASGRCSEVSEWPWSTRDEGALSPRTFVGPHNRTLGTDSSANLQSVRRCLDYARHDALLVVRAFTAGDQWSPLHCTFEKIILHFAFCILHLQASNS